MQLGDNIYKLRKKCGFSQEKLAEKIDVTRQTISNWELGATSPNPEQLILLSKALNISIDELVGNEIDLSKNNEKCNDRKAFTSIYLPFSIICGSIAGICSFSANRFRNDEILLIIVAGMIVGGCLGVICKNILKK